MNLNLNKIIGLVVVLAAFGLQAVPSKAFVKTGGVLILNDKGTYYLQSNEYTEVNYRDVSISQDAKVELQFGYVCRSIDASNKVHDMRWDKGQTTELTRVAPGVWSKTLMHMRHGLGDTWKSSGLNFLFQVTVPGQPAFVNHCNNDGKSFYTAEFPDIFTLPWETSGESPLMVAVGLSCDKSN